MQNELSTTIRMQYRRSAQACMLDRAGGIFPYFSAAALDSTERLSRNSAIIRSVLWSETEGRKENAVRKKKYQREKSHR